MNPEQKAQAIQQIQAALQQGRKPEEVVQALMQSGLDQASAVALVQEAVQGGGQPQQGTAGQTGATAEEASQVLASVLESVGPEVLLATIMAYEQLPREEQSALKTDLQGMMQQGASQEPQQQPDAQAQMERGMFGA